jgi:hypothetical protein
MSVPFSNLHISNIEFAIGLVIVFSFLTLFSRHLLSFVAGAILAAAAVLVWLVPSSTPTIVATACAAGSILVLWIGRRLRIDKHTYQRDLRSITDRLDMVASQNTLADIRLAELRLDLEHHEGARIVPSAEPLCESPASELVSLSSSPSRRSDHINGAPADPPSHQFNQGGKKSIYRAPKVPPGARTNQKS